MGRERKSKRSLGCAFKPFHGHFRGRHFVSCPTNSNYARFFSCQPLANHPSPSDSSTYRNTLHKDETLLVEIPREISFDPSTTKSQPKTSKYCVDFSGTTVSRVLRISNCVWNCIVNANARWSLDCWDESYCFSLSNMVSEIFILSAANY